MVLGAVRPVETVLALAQLGAFAARVEALAVFFLALGLLAVTRFGRCTLNGAVD